MIPLIGIAAAVLPDIVKLIAGDKTGQLADQVGKAVSDTLGTTNAAEAQTKLAADPAAQAALQQKLTEIALDATKVQNAEADQQRQDALANTQGARSALQALTTTNSTIARTAPAISYIVTLGFFLFLGVLVWLYKSGPPAVTADQAKTNFADFIPQIINITVGALTAAFATVVNFWLGSSAGSQKKDDANLTLQTAQSDRTTATMSALQSKIASQQPTPVQTPATTQAPAAAKPTDQQSSARFDACMPFIFKAEGGYSDTPGDPGGPTNFGITLATLKAYESNQNLTADDVKKLTPAIAKEIYRANYWNRMQCGALPAGLDLEVFDFGVNAGPGEAVKMLQKIVGVTADGSIGPITLAALGQLKPRDLISQYSQARLAYYKGLNNPEFEQGWTNRANQIQMAAAQMLDASQVAAA
jgi:glycosyl hydrolase family 108/predicted peptidoglycan binding protein